MIKMLMVLMVMTSALTLSSAKNPMKASVIILILAAMSFLILKMKTGMTWFPLLMFLLFAGGILMMFMILSSILPNEKSMKSKIPKISMVIAAIMLSNTMIMSVNSKENLGEVKSMITSSALFISLTLLIMLYFFYSMELNQAENNPMRSFSCCEMSNFVNC